MRLRQIIEGVGRITKQNQTADVGPNEIKKQAAKFGNTVDKDGRPPTLSNKVKGKSTNVLFNLGLTENINELDIPRHLMPQIDVSDLKEKYKIKQTHAQIDQLKTSQNERVPGLLDKTIKNIKNGQHKPLIVDKNGYIVNGHHRYDAYRKLKITRIPIVIVKDATLKDLMNAFNHTVSKRYAENFAEDKMGASKTVEEGPKDFGDMKLDAKGKQDSIDYFYKDHAPSMGKPVKAGKLGSYDIVTVTKGPTTLMFLVDANDSAVFYVAFDKYQDGVAIGNVRSNGTVKATDVYAYLVKKYGKLYSDIHQTPSGRKIWDNLSKYTKLKVTDVGDRLVATENFADGKVKGKSRPGRVKRAGASCNGSVTALRKRAKNASGEKAKMLHWCINMKAGRQKKNK